MALKINEKLCFTFPITRPNGNQVWVHATPISREVFSAHWRILSQTFARLFGAGISPGMSLRMAALCLRELAVEQDIWEDDPKRDFIGVKTSLLGEIRRLAMVMAPSARHAVAGDAAASIVEGWNKVMLDDALKSGIFDEDEASEVEAVIVFFTVISWVMRRTEADNMMTAAGRPFGGQLSSLNSTAFRDSLPTSSAAETTSTPPTMLSVPA